MSRIQRSPCDVPWATLCLALWLGVALPLSGCSSGGAADLFATAELEEVQNSPDRARQLYEQIVQRYPDSPEAEKARARLGALGAPSR